MSTEDQAAGGRPKKDRLYFETVIIGTGFSGILAAIGLRKNNITDFVLLERDPEIGGTWQANSYPGAEVDIPTGLYSISFIPYKFTKKYAPQSELLQYTKYVIDKFDIRKNTRTNQSVATLRYDETEYLWNIDTEAGDSYSARFIIDASGVLANPKIPYIQGAETFQGAKFHTARWDHNTSCKGKRVGVIGSGCSGAQVVPAIAGEVDRLTLFMGTPEWIIPRFDRSYSALERSAINLPVVRHINRFMVFIVHEARFIGFRRYPFTSKISKFIKTLYTRNLRNNLEKYIKDEKLRKYMMPDYELGCRRVMPTNKYLPALSRENVDVDISGIERITPTGIITREGKDIPLDMIVYATGFFAYSDMKEAFSFQIYGREGRNLNSEWEKKTASYKGITVSGYPNYFKINGPNTGTGHSSQLCYMETMADYIVKAICAVKRDESIKAIDVKADVQSDYMEKMRKDLKKTVWQTGGCTAFYRKNTTDEVTSLSPESVIHFIFGRKNFHLSDYNVDVGDTLLKH